MALDLTGPDKTFRRYAAIEGVNHPPVPTFFEHTRPNGDIIGPAGVWVDGVLVPPVFTAATTGLLTTVGHGLAVGVRLRFTTTGTLPAGLSLATDYYVIASGLTADAFKVSATDGGSAVDITSTGTGVHSWARYLTTDEQAALTRYLAHPFHETIVEAQLVLWVAAYNAYRIHPQHKAWMVDDFYQRHWQHIYRSSDHADIAQGVTPPSGDAGGSGGGAPHSPVIVSLA